MKSFSGKFNSLQRHGTLIKDPHFLLRREGSNIEYGTFQAPSDTQLEYLIYRTSATTFGNISEYVKKEQPEVEVLTQEKKYLLKFQNGKWDVIDEKSSA